MSRPAACVALLAILLLSPARALAQHGEGASGLGAPSPDEPSPSAEPPPPPPPAGYPAGDEPPPGTYPKEPHSARLDDDAASSEGVRVPSRIATRIRVLEANLNHLATRGSSHIVNGILSVLAGGLSITFGVLANSGTEDDTRFARYLFLWGSGQIARGVLDFAIPSNADEAAIEYQHMPMGNHDEVRSRLHYGEDALEGIARRARIGRLLDASINVGMGLAAVPVYLAADDFEINTPSDWFVMFASGISVITGVVNFIIKTDAEKRWNAYEKLRDRLVDEREALELGVAPVRGGALGTMRTRF